MTARRCCARIQLYMWKSHSGNCIENPKEKKKNECMVFNAYVMYIARWHSREQRRTTKFQQRVIAKKKKEKSDELFSNPDSLSLLLRHLLRLLLYGRFVLLQLRRMVRQRLQVLGHLRYQVRRSVPCRRIRVGAQLHV